MTRLGDIPDAAVKAAAGVLLAEIALSEDDTKWCMAVAMKTLTAALPHLAGEMVGKINRMGERNDELDAEVAALLAGRDAETARIIDRLSLQVGEQRAEIAGLEKIVAEYGDIIATMTRFSEGNAKEIVGLEDILRYRWKTYGALVEKTDRCIAQQQEEIARLRASVLSLLKRDQINTCTHDETHRGGFLWEICDSCGAKWADDEGGKPEWNDPPEWEEASAALEPPA